MNLRSISFFVSSLLASAAMAEADCDFGADLRIRQEIMDNVPGLPGGGLLSTRARGKVRNHVRFRPRVWGEFRFGDEDVGFWRLYARLTDEFRWNVTPSNRATTFPDELVLDNLFVEGKGLFDGLIDLRIGRQDLYRLYGLDHVFVDGTPGDGSRSTFSDVAGITFNFSETSKLDLFALYNRDANELRWGTHRSRNRSLSGLGGGAEPEMDDWGFGAIWSSRLGEAFPYQLFAMQKDTASFMRGGVKHPSTRRDLIGFKLLPRLTDDLTLQFEGMAQTGRNGSGDALFGWSAYAGGEWRDASKTSMQPFVRMGFHYLSGDDNAANEDGGHGAWDPMWARGVNDSELFLYGTHYGAAWWSNLLYFKTTCGIEIGRYHDVVLSTGPMFADAQDGLGGGDGAYKGLLSQLRYDFPLIVADREKGSRFELFGHLLAEFFNPGDYFATDKPSWFVRWQLDLRF